MTPTSDAVVVVLMAAGTTAAAIVDLRTRRVPNALTMPLASAGIALAAAGLGRVGVTSSLTGCALGLLLMLPAYVFGATGAGDVKLLAAAGAFLGPGATLTAFLYTALAGGAIALVVAARRRNIRQTLQQTAWLVTGGAGATAAIEHPLSNNRFAYAPAIACGAVLAALG